MHFLYLRREFAKQVALDEVRKNKSQLVPPQSQEVSFLLVFFTVDNGNVSDAADWALAYLFRLWLTPLFATRAGMDSGKHAQAV